MRAHLKKAFFAIFFPWITGYGCERSFLLIFSARDDLVKVSWKSDVGKCQNQLTPPYFDQLSERHQPLLHYNSKKGNLHCFIVSEKSFECVKVWARKSGCVKFLKYFMSVHRLITKLGRACISITDMWPQLTDKENSLCVQKKRLQVDLLVWNFVHK